MQIVPKHSSSRQCHHQPRRLRNFSAMEIAWANIESEDDANLPRMRPVFTSSSLYAVCEHQTRGNLLFTSFCLSCVRSLSLPNYVIVTYLKPERGVGRCSRDAHLHGQHIPQWTDEGHTLLFRMINRLVTHSSWSVSLVWLCQIDSFSGFELRQWKSARAKSRQEEERHAKTNKPKQKAERSFFNANLGSAFRLNSTRNHSCLVTRCELMMENSPKRFSLSCKSRRVKTEKSISKASCPCRVVTFGFGSHREERWEEKASRGFTSE